jgi:hypothetical protein
LIAGGAAWFYRADLSLRVLDTGLQWQLSYSIVDDLPDLQAAKRSTFPIGSERGKD